MPLTDRAIRAMKPASKSYRRADAHGLYIEAFPNGSKHWRLKYRYGGKEKRIALGSYPEVGLAEARRRRDDARSLLQRGMDPSLERRKAKAAAKVSAENSFGKVAEEYIAKMSREGRADSTVTKAKWFLSLLRPSIGAVPVDQVDPQTLLEALKKLESRGILETARKARSFCSRVFRYAVVTARAPNDPAALLMGALLAPTVQHHQGILEPRKVGELLLAIDGYGGSPSTNFALKIAPHVFLRPIELRLAQWAEIDFEKRVWCIPAERMKTRRPHGFPMSRQVCDLLKELREITGPSGYVFPAFHTSRRPLSENTLNGALRRIGFPGDVMVAHGFRVMASTLLNESNKFSHDAIERALSHKDTDAIRGTYNRGSRWDERVRMAQWWSDYLDSLRVKASSADRDGPLEHETSTSAVVNIAA